MLHYSSETKNDIKKYLVYFMIIVSFGLYVVYTALAWGYTQASTDVLFMGGWLPFAMRILLELFDVAIFAGAYFCIVYAFFRMEAKKAWLFPILYLLLALVRRALTLLIQFIQVQYVGSDDILSLVLYYAFDAIQLFIVLAIIIYEVHKCKSFIKAHEEASLAAPAFLPFTTVFDKNNPLQMCSLKLAIMISGIKIFTRIISDLYYGAPESLAEALIMVAYYASDLLNGVVFYTILWFLFSHINKKETALQNSKAETL